MQMYEIVKYILTKEKTKEEIINNPDFDKMFSGYMLCRYLSMRKDLIIYAKIINHFNIISNLTKEMLFKLVYDLIPKQKNGYVKYIKKDKKKESKQKSKK